MKFHDLTFTGGAHGKDLAVWLDGMRVHGVTGLTIIANTHDAVRAQFELIVKAVAQINTEIEMPSVDDLPDHIKAIYNDLAKLVGEEPVPLSSGEIGMTLLEGAPMMIVCTHPDHQDMPEHYHPKGQWDSRLDRLEEFHAAVRKALEEGGNPKSQIEIALEQLEA